MPVLIFELLEIVTLLGILQGKIYSTLELNKFWKWLSNLLTGLSLIGLSESLKSWRDLFVGVHNQLVDIGLISLVLKVFSAIFNGYDYVVSSLLFWVGPGFDHLLIICSIILIPSVQQLFGKKELPILESLEKRLVYVLFTILILCGVQDYIGGVPDSLVFPIFYPVLTYILFSGISIIVAPLEAFEFKQRISAITFSVPVKSRLKYAVIGLLFCIATLSIPGTKEFLQSNGAVAPDKKEAYLFFGMATFFMVLHLFFKYLDSKAKKSYPIII